MEAMEKFQPQDPGHNELRRKQAAENALFRVDIRRSLRLYRGVAIGTAAVVFAVLVTLIALSKKHYSAECIVSVAPSAQHLMSDPNGPTWGSDSLTYDTAIDQQIQLVHRYDVLAKAIASPGVKWREDKETEQQAVNRLVKALSVTRVEKSYQMAISVTADNPAQAVLLADAVAASFLEVSKEDGERDTREHMAALLSERTQLQASLDAKIAEQSAILQKVHIAPGSTAAVDSEFAGLSAAAAEAKVKHDAAEAQLRSLELPGAEASMSSETSSFPMANSLQEKKNTLQAQMAGLTPLNPLYKADQAQLAEIDQQIAEGSAKTRALALTREQSKARTELAAETAQEAALTERLAAAAAKVSKSTPDIEQSNALATEITRLETRYGAVDDRIRNLALDNGTTSQLELTSLARAPLQPNPNKRNMFLLLLLPAPLLAGILAAVLALKIDPRIYSAADVEAVTGYAPFATLLHRKEASPEVMEEYLLRMAAGVESLHTTRGVRTILVTGNSADSGASSIATALALKLQQVSRDSAVLDADADEASVTQEDIRALSEKHGLLLVDCPPILSSARAEYLARFTDAVLLIAESGKTTRSELRRAMKLLEKVNAGGVAVVLNKVTLTAAEDAVQSEVAEMEQRILERGSAGYTRPALRLYNTQAPERLSKTVPDEEPRRVEAPKATAVEDKAPVAPVLAQPAEVATPEPVAGPEVEVQTVSVAEEIEPAPQTWPTTPPQLTRTLEALNEAVNAYTPNTAENAAYKPPVPEPEVPEAIAIEPAPVVSPQVDAPAVAAIVEESPAAEPASEVEPLPAPQEPLAAEVEQIAAAAASAVEVTQPASPAQEPPPAQISIEPRTSPHLVPEPEHLRPVAAFSPRPEPVPVQPPAYIQKPVVPISVAHAPAAPSAPVVPAEYARQGAPTTLQGVFGVRKKDPAPLTAMPSPPAEAQPEPETEPVADIWRVQPLQRTADIAHVPEAADQHSTKDDEALDEIPIITPNQDPKPPRHTLVQPREHEASRNIFRFPWKKESNAKSTTDLQEGSVPEVAEAEFIAPVKPLPGTPLVHETYVPVPSHGWLRGKKGNPGAPQEKPKEQPKRSRNTEWMDRAEIERQILGNPRRKD